MCFFNACISSNGSKKTDESVNGEFEEEKSSHLHKFCFPPYGGCAPTNHIFFCVKETDFMEKVMTNNEKVERAKYLDLRNIDQRPNTLQDTIIRYICINNAASKCTKSGSIRQNTLIPLVCLPREYTPITVMQFTYKNFPSSQSDAILKSRGGLSGLPSMRNS